MDDCSTDQSVEKIENFIKKDDTPCRLVVHQSNKGAASARNTIIEEAKGEFIAFFDDDDISLPHRLQSK